jgi:hypothetical protein
MNFRLGDYPLKQKKFGMSKFGSIVHWTEVVLFEKAAKYVPILSYLHSELCPSSCDTNSNISFRGHDPPRSRAKYKVKNLSYSHPLGPEAKNGISCRAKRSRS